MDEVVNEALYRAEEMGIVFLDEIDKVARFNSRSVERLLGDAGIVRHRGKIESTLNNARRAKELIDEHGSLAGWLWAHEPPASARERAFLRRRGGGTRGRVSRLSALPAG